MRARSEKKAGPRTTPMMRQYLEIKAQHPDALLLFRMGDFYETFFDDAELASSVLGLTLTSREKQGGDPIPLAGVPHHALDHYLARLLDHGCTVAICEQTEDPAQAKGIVRREVVEVISPGTITQPGLLRDDHGRALLAVLPSPDRAWGWAVLDGATGEFRCGSADRDDALALTRRFPIAEVLVPEDADGDEEFWRDETGVATITRVSTATFSSRFAVQRLTDHFALRDLTGLGLDAEDPSARAAAAALGYLSDRQHAAPAQVRDLEVDRPDDRLYLDRETIAHLELFSGLRAGEKETSLFHHIDHTRTPMGRRRLARWLRAPLCDLAAIEARLDAVAWLVDHATRAEAIRELLGGSGDLERVVGRIATQRALPHELAALRDGLRRSPEIARLVADDAPPALHAYVDLSPELARAGSDLASALRDEVPTHLRQGGVFADGHDAELDRLRSLNRDGKQWIALYQESERERTGISTLKVGYNKVFGYHVEVTNKHLDKVPDAYVEKQRLAGGKRYVTEELKAREQEILRAHDDQIAREQELFRVLLAEWQPRLGALHAGLSALSDLDAFASLADVARHRRYVRPMLDDSHTLSLGAARHPVVERLTQDSFVPNDLHLDRDDAQILLLTGPNMGGKSTYLRQAALVVVLAQMGSFVPAERARVGLVDRLFTRVGASDNLARGQSTFLVEMAETAKILRGATERSLVIFDEVGRGTSTQDGLALAQAITEFLHDGAQRPRTLFATHFHELTALAKDHARLRNARLDVREWEGRILFLHRVVEGASDRSYGLHVAELAGVPAPVVERARDLLDAAPERPAATGPAKPQLALFETRTDPLRVRLRDIDPDQLTPLQGLGLLAELVREARRGT